MTVKHNLVVHFDLVKARSHKLQDYLSDASPLSVVLCKQVQS